MALAYYNRKSDIVSLILVLLDLNKDQMTPKIYAEIVKDYSFPCQLFCII